MRVSIVIPTYEGAETLGRTLRSILFQTVKPYEVIVVDDHSRTKSVRNLVAQFKSEFDRRGINLVYMKAKGKYRSASRARNMGISASRGDILLFLDDDVILDRRYIEAILKVFHLKDDAVGVGGYIINPPKQDPYRKAFCKVFYLGTSEKDRCCWGFYPYPLTKLIRCCWLSGGNMAIRKDAIGDLRFDESLLFYSYGEDVLFSWSLGKLRGGLYVTPEAKMIHLSKRIKGFLNYKARELITTVYGSYLWIKIRGRRFSSILKLTWRNFGRLLGGIVTSIGSRRGGIIAFWRLRASFILLLRFKEILKLDLKGFNEKIIGDVKEGVQVTI